jgi:acetolactate synthase regulatory subunit
MSATVIPPVALARRLELATTGEPDVLPRVLTWLRRHGCALTRLDYQTADRHGPGRFVVAVDVPQRHADRLASGLRNLVGVVDVSVG